MKDRFDYLKEYFWDNINRSIKALLQDYAGEISALHEWPKEPSDDLTDREWYKNACAAFDAVFVVVDYFTTYDHLSYKHTNAALTNLKDARDYLQEGRANTITEILDEIFFPFYQLAEKWGAGVALTDYLDSVRGDCETALYARELDGKGVERRLKKALDAWMEDSFVAPWDKEELPDHWDELIARDAE